MSFKRGIFVIAVVMIFLCGCGEKELKPVTSSNESVTENIAVLEPSSFTESDMFTERDKKQTADLENAKTLTLKNNDSVTVTKEGVYVVSGKSENGQIIVDADKTAKIQIMLDGVEISSKNSAPIYIKSADKVFLTLKEGTENTLTTTAQFVADGETNVDGVIFSKADLTLNGSGSLAVETQNGHGIVTKDDLVITGGTYNVTATSHALSGKDSIRISGGEFSLTSGKDALHAENTENTEKGFIYLSGGKFDIVSEGDGIDASNSVAMTGGEFKVTCGGGSQNAEKKSKEFGFYGRGNEETAETSTASCKGIKSDGILCISGGEFTINSADDSLHCADNLEIKKGEINIATGDDGLHSDKGVKIDGGEIQINQSYEGIEGNTIDINGGNITLKASDDGLNAAGGNDQSGFGGMMGRDPFSSDSSCYIKITGGILKVNADGDGIDSNGGLYVEGGKVYVEGPQNSGNGALDYGGEAEISGGVFIATGAFGMAQNFGSNSTQGVMLVNVGNATGEIKLCDSNGKTLLTFTSNKSYQCAIISTPEIKKGEEYTVTTQNGKQTVQMTDTVYGSSGMGAGRPEMGGSPDKFGRGDRP